MRLAGLVQGIANVGCRYTPAIEAINEKLKAYAQLNTRVEFVDCSPVFLEDDDKVGSWLVAQ